MAVFLRDILNPKIIREADSRAERMILGFRISRKNTAI